MSVSLFVAPGGAGKTRYALQLVRRATSNLQQIARVCVANRQQVLSWQRRLVQGARVDDAPGCLGVEVMTFDHLYAACLDAAGVSFTRIPDAVEHRLLRTVASQLDLEHYAALRRRPGFVQELQRLVSEFKSTQLSPQQLADAIATLGNEPRLAELAQVYERYDEMLQEHQWADYRSLGWLAIKALQDDTTTVAEEWPLLVVDGFDSFTQTQMALLQQLGRRVDKLVVTLTGEARDRAPRRAHRRFRRTQRELEERLDVAARPLPSVPQARLQPGALAHLQQNLFTSTAKPLEDDGRVQMLEAPNPAAEVREALRWLKQCIVEDNARPHELALLARDLQSYAPFIEQTAAEFGLPIYMLDGRPLAQNPCIAALLNLLHAILPAGAGQNRADEARWEPALPRRAVLAALRSPYFDWTGHTAVEQEEEHTESGFTARDVASLDAVARHWRVVGGREQWLEALAAAAGRPQPADDEYEKHQPETTPPTGEAARHLWQKFERFLELIRPLHGKRRWREHVGWLETLLGPDPAAQEDAPIAGRSLDVVARARAGYARAARHDIAALRKLKQVLSSLVWAEEAGILHRPLTFPEFVEEVVGAVDATRYEAPPAGEAILVAPLQQARGVPFRAVALVGLAEGVFPAVLTADPFLRESDRQRLREEHDFSLESSVESAEAEYFYEIIIRPWERLLLTRPRLAEGGANWEPSPFWEEVQRMVDVQPRRVETEEAPTPQAAASPAELLESLCQSEHNAASRWCEAQWPGRLQRVHDVARLFGERYEAQKSLHDGALHDVSSLLRESFGPGHHWSATRLERYLTCPFFFFVGDVLQKETRVEPEVGLDARQLGSIYHRLLEHVYQQVPQASRQDPEALEAALDEVAPPLLDRAPHREGFRASAWWQQTRREIVENVRRSLRAMAQQADGFVPAQFERRFFGPQALTVEDDDGKDAFRLHGVIDRVDVDEQGQLRIIDYKTAGPYKYGRNALLQGRTLQLPLYALAAEKALQLGPVVDGYYWHVQHAEASGLQLADLGPEEAMAIAAGHAWHAVRGVRAGDFRPQPPPDGCPTYCPAAAFCWHYSPSRNW